MEAFGDRDRDVRTRGKGEWVALGALLLPWYVLSLMLPLPHLAVAVALLTALASLLATAVTWSRLRAMDLGLDADSWGLAAVLSLGFSMLLLVGTAQGSGYESLCMDCGKLSDARTPFCYSCGAYG